MPDATRESVTEGRCSHGCQEDSLWSLILYGRMTGQDPHSGGFHPAEGTVEVGPLNKAAHGPLPE